MLERLDPEGMLVSHLAWIEKTAAVVCRRNSVWGEDAADFASLVKLRLIEDDYAILRKFRGDSGLATYLAAVVVQLFQEHARSRWGRWRHSAAAERLGPVAKDLECLVLRDGLGLREAGEKIRSVGRTTASDLELARLLAQLPEREPMRPVEVGAEPLEWAIAPEPADGRVTLAEREAEKARVRGAVERVMARLEPEDRLIAEMHFADRVHISDVARALGVPQQSLYRRKERLKERLRREMEAEGLSGADVLNLQAEVET
jgi:RNA polymerase sigma factor (sigma-70 family)